MDSNNDKSQTGSNINDILRDLKPRGMDIPPPRPPLVDPLPDFKPGGIDAILASLQPKKPPYNVPAAGTKSPASESIKKPASAADGIASSMVPDEHTKSTTASTRRHLANLQVASVRGEGSGFLDANDMTPEARLEMRKANERMKNEAKREERTLNKDIEKLKRKIAEAEAENAKHSNS